MKHGEMGKRLRKLRIHLKVTQTALAKKCNVSRRVIYNYERGCSLSVDLADAILKELGAICILGVNLTEDESLFIRQALHEYRKQTRKARSKTLQNGVQAPKPKK